MGKKMYDFQIEANVDNLYEVKGFIESALEGLECSKKARLQIDLAVEEIFVNIANYAYAPEVGDAEIHLEVLDEPSAVNIIFIDRGMPYDPLKKEDPDVTLSLEERGVGGLGIFMVKKIMDDMRYEYRDGKNVLTLYKEF